MSPREIGFEIYLFHFRLGQMQKFFLYSRVLKKILYEKKQIRSNLFLVHFKILENSIGCGFQKEKAFLNGKEIFCCENVPRFLFQSHTTIF